MPDQKRPRFRLTIRSEPSETPAVIRLRHVLKGLLRAWGFRAEVVEDITGGEGKPGIGGREDRNQPPQEG